MNRNPGLSEISDDFLVLVRSEISLLFPDRPALIGFDPWIPGPEKWEILDRIRCQQIKFRWDSNSFFDDLTSSSIDMSEMPEISSSLSTILETFSWLIQKFYYSGLFLCRLSVGSFSCVKKRNIEFCSAGMNWKYSRAQSEVNRYLWKLMNDHDQLILRNWFFDH